MILGVFFSAIFLICVFPNDQWCKLNENSKEYKYYLSALLISFVALWIAALVEAFRPNAMLCTFTTFCGGLVMLMISGREQKSLPGALAAITIFLSFLMLIIAW